MYSYGVIFLLSLLLGKATRVKKMTELLYDMMEGTDYGQLTGLISAKTETG